MGVKMELGSEFWDMPSNETSATISDRQSRFVLSGRTALELVAQDLISDRGIRSVYLPAFCCESMILPFRRAGLELHFYDVIPSDNGVRRILSDDHNFDAVLLLDYFGFTQQETIELAKHEHDRGTAVILDRVQSMYSSDCAVEFADYAVTSWRKWFFSCAAEARKINGEWLVNPSRTTNEKYVSLRKEAARLKQAYLYHEEGQKQEFLDAFAEAEKLLDADFSGFAADTESMKALRYLDTSFLGKRRRENTAVIYEALSAMDDIRIRPLFSQPETNDVPLFVPVMVDPAIRSDLRKWLIQNQVYCPVHWPSVQTGGGEVLFAQELSLICDQRYSKEEIRQEMNLIKEFFDNYV